MDWYTIPLLLIMFASGGFICWSAFTMGYDRGIKDAEKTIKQLFG